MEQPQEKPQIQVIPPTVKASGINWSDIIGRIIKYIVEGTVVALVAYLLPKKDKKMTTQEVLILGLTAASVFLILDLFAPAVGLATRQGAGFGLGATMIGFPGIGVPQPPTGMMVPPMM